MTQRNRLGALAVLCALLSTSVALAAGSGPLRGAIVENRGQADARARFVTRRDRQVVVFERGAVRLASLLRGRGVERVTESLVLHFVGGRPDVEPMGDAPLHGRVNVLVGDEAGWIRGIPTWESVVYRDVWPGIDAVFRSEDPSLKSELLVAPGADPSLIAWTFDGALDVALDAEGALRVQTPAREVKDGAPVAWQTLGGERVPVDARFDVGPLGEVRFALGPYDPTEALVIDPPLAFSTFFGGTSDEAFEGVTVGPDGSVYAVGWSGSAGLASPDVFQSTHHGAAAGSLQSDGLLVKFLADGTLDFATYLGGQKAAMPSAFSLSGFMYLAWTLLDDVALMPDSGRIVVVGLTRAVDFPMVSSIANVMTKDKDKLVDSTDGVMAILSPQGDSLWFSTFYGGRKEDEITHVSVRGSRIAFAGRSDAVKDELPVPTGLYETPIIGGTSSKGAFVGELEAGTVSDPTTGAPKADVDLISAIGFAHPGITGVALAQDDVASYVALTLSQGPGAFVQIPAKNAVSQFPETAVVKLLLSKQAATKGASWLRWVGGAGDDAVSAMDVGPQGLVVAGCTTTGLMGFPPSKAYDVQCGSSHGCGGHLLSGYPWSDGFLQILTADGELVSGTYLGGDAGDCITGVSASAKGIAVTGWTEAPNFPTVAAFHPDSGDPRSKNLPPWVTSGLPQSDDEYVVPFFDSNGFFALLSADGHDLLLSTRIDGQDELLSDVAFDPTRERGVVVGGTYSPDYPRVHATQTTHASPKSCKSVPDDYSQTGTSLICSQALDAVVTSVNTDVADVRIVDAVVAPKGAKKGENTTITVTVRNDGPKPATATKLMLLPDVALTAKIQHTCAEVAGTVTCDVGTLARGATWTTTFTYTNPPGPGFVSYTHVLAVGSAVNDPAPDNNKRVVKATAGGFDLELTEEGTGVAPGPVQTEAKATVTARVKNHGPDPAAGVTVSCVLPEAFEAPTAPGCTVALAKGQRSIECPVGDLASGAVKTLSFETKAPPTEGAFKVACIASAADISQEADPSDDVRAIVIDVQLPDLVLTSLFVVEPAAVAGAHRVAREGTIRLEAEVWNKGTGDVDAVMLRLPLADPTVTAKTTGCSESFAGAGMQLSCPVLGSSQAVLPKGGKAKLTLELTAPKTIQKLALPATVIHLSAATGNGDHAPADNNRAVAVLVGGADVALTGVGDTPDPSVDGGVVALVGTLTNHGPDAAPNPMLTVTLPAGAGTVNSVLLPDACKAVTAGESSASCTTGELAAGASVGAFVFVTPAPLTGKSATLLTSLVATSDATDLDPANGKHVETTTIVEGADLAIPTATVSVSPAKLAEEGTATLGATVQNEGPGEAKDLKVAVTATGKASIQTATLGGSPCTRLGATELNCVAPTLAKGGTLAVVVALKALPGAADDGSVGLSIGATSAVKDPTPADATAVRSVPVVKGAKPRFAVSAPKTPVGAGSVVSFGAPLTNEGPDAMTGVVVTGSVAAAPAGVEISSPAGCTWAPDKRGFTCPAADLAKGASKPLAFQVSLPADLLDASDPNATAKVPVDLVVTGAPEEDPQPELRKVTHVLTVVNGADLSVVFPAPQLPQRIAEGGVKTLTGQLKNAGPRTATASKLTLCPGPFTTILSAKLDGASCGPKDACVVCPAGDVAKGELRAVAVTIRAEPGAAAPPSRVRLVAKAETERVDVEPADNEVTIDITAEKGADLQIQAFTDEPDPVPEGGTLTWSLRVCNKGPEDYAAADGKSVRVNVAVDTAGLALTPAAQAGPCALAEGAVGWVCPALAAGACIPATSDQWLKVVVPIPADALPADPDATRVITAVASVLGDREDPTDGTANQAIAQTTVTHATNLHLVVVATPEVGPAGVARVAVGGTDVFAVRVLNEDAKASAKGAQLTLTVPAGVLELPAQGGGCTVDGNKATCKLPELAPGAQWPGPEAFVLTVKGTAAGQGPVALAVGVPGKGDKTPGDNASSVIVAVEPGADVQFGAVTVVPLPAWKGAAVEAGTVDVAPKVCNGGTEDVDGVTVVVESDLSLLTPGSLPAGSCTQGQGQPWTCPVGTLPAPPNPGACVQLPSLRFDVTDSVSVPPGAETVAAALTVRLYPGRSRPDPNPGNDTVKTLVNVSRRTRLSLTATGPGGGAPKKALKVDESVVQVVTVHNAADAGRTESPSLEIERPHAMVELTAVDGATGACAPDPTANDLVLCPVGALAPGASKTLTLTWTGRKAGQTTINYAVEPLRNLSTTDNRAAIQLDISGAELAITALNDVAVAGVGDVVAHTITVENQNELDADGTKALLRATWPPALFSAPIPPAGLTCSKPDATGTVSCPLPPIKYLQPLVLPFQAIAKAKGEATVTFDAGSETDISPADNIRSDSLTIDGADLGASVDVAPTSLADGPIPLSVGLTNNGPAAARGARLECVVTGPATLSPGGVCTATPGGFTCAAADPLPKSAAPKFAIALDATGAGEAMVTCKSAQTGEDTDPTNDTSMGSTLIRGADLRVAAPAGDTVGAGEARALPFTVHNDGPARADAVTATVAVPAGLKVTATAGCTAGFGGGWTCTLGSIASGAASPLALTAVAATPGTYPVTVSVSAKTPDDGAGANAGVSVTVVQDGAADADGDGVADSAEDAAPGGDGNGDGVPDKQQANVASVRTAASQTVTLVAGAGATLGKALATVPVAPPPGVRFPVDALSFEVTVPTPGASTTLDVILPTGVPAFAYWKYGPTAALPTPHWYDFTFDGTTGAEKIAGNRLRLTLVDGGRGDSDLAANGVIVDPGAPALGPLAVLTVTNGRDFADAAPGDGVCADVNDGTCGLRAAIEELNALGQPGAIEVALLGRTVVSVGDDAGGAPLPPVAVPVLLDGSGGAGAVLLALDGFGLHAAGADVDGLVLAGGDSTARGVEVFGFGGDGVKVTGLGRVRVTGCALGTDTTGGGLSILGDALVIDGVERCLVDGSWFAWAHGAGVALRGATGAEVRGCTFDATDGDHVVVDGGAGNRVGAPGARNTIMTALGAGVRVTGGAVGTVVGSNDVGLDPGGVCAWRYPAGHPCNLPDGGGLTCEACQGGNAVGVLVEGGASGTVIGAPGAGNAFGDNSVGVRVAADAAGASIAANTFGTQADGGCGARGCPADGGIDVVGPGVVVGGAEAGAGNLLAAGAGIEARQAADGVVVRGNVVGLLGDLLTVAPGGGAAVTLTDAAGAVVADNTLVARSEGLRLEGASGATVEGNRLGLGADGATRTGAGLNVGVDLTSSALGSTGDAHVVGNAFGDAAVGVLISGGSAQAGALAGNVVEGNTFGLGSDGAPLGVETGVGVLVRQWYELAKPGLAPPDAPAPSGTIVRDNVFAGAGAVDVAPPDGFADWTEPAAIMVVRAKGTVVEGNLVGVGADGVTPVPAGAVGVAVRGAQGTVLQDNVLGGAGVGVSLEVYPTDGAAPLGTVLRGNRVGVDAAGAPLPNAGAGVRATGAADFDTVVGGGVGDGNVIAHNGGDGVRAQNATGITIRRNTLVANGGLGIDLGDAGPGGVLPGTPVVTLTSATASGGVTVVAGTVDGPAGQAVAVDFYAQPEADPSGFGEGETWLGSATVTPAGHGPVALGASLPGALSGLMLTATPTNTISGTTGELSHAIIVGPSTAADLRVGLAAPATLSSWFGDTVVVTVTNDGPGATTATSATVDLPAPLVVNDAWATSGGCGVTDHTATCALGPLAPGSSVTVTVSVGATGSGAATVLAAVSAPEADPVPGNDTASATVVADPPTLSLAAAFDETFLFSTPPLPPGIPAAHFVGVGEPFVVDLTVFNGTVTATDGVWLTGVTPAGVQLVEASSSQGTCAASAPLSCDLGAVPGLGGVTVHAVLVATLPFEAGTLSFEVGAAGPDQQPFDNVASLTLYARHPMADLTLSGEAVPVEASSGAPLDFHVGVASAGPHALHGFSLQATTTGALDVTGATANGATCAVLDQVITCDAGTCQVVVPAVDCSIATLEPGGAVDLVVTTLPTGAGPVTLSAYLTNLEVFDPSPGHAIAIDAAVDPSDLGVDVADAVDPVTAGQPVVWTVTVTNHSAKATSGVVAALTLPPGVLAKATPSQGTCSGASAPSCALGSLSGGASATITVTATAPEGVHALSATVSGAGYDPVEANDAATETTTVIGGSACPPGEVATALVPDDTESGGGLFEASYDGYPWALEAAPDGGHHWFVPGVPGLHVRDLTLAVPIDVPAGASSVRLSFLHAYQFPYGVDGGYVEVGLGDGNFTFVNSFDEKGYDGTIYASQWAPGAFTGTSPGYPDKVLSVADLTGWAGGPLQLRLRVASMGNADYGGWAVDGLKVEACLPGPPAPALALTGEVTPQAVVGDDVVFTLTVHNDGAAGADAVQVGGTLAGPLAGATVTSSQGTCALSDTLACSLGAIGAGAQATVSVVAVAVDEGGASLDATVGQGDLIDDAVSLSTGISGASAGGADLGVAVTVPGEPAVGSPVEVVVTVTQGGPGAADDVELAVELPAGWTLLEVQATGDCGLLDGVLTCGWATLPPGAEEVVTLTLLAPDVAGEGALVASVSGGGGDPAPANDVVPVALSARPHGADLVTTLGTDGPWVVGEGGSVLVGVANGGPDMAFDVTVDLLVAGPVAVTAPDGCVPIEGGVRCALGDLPPGGGATATVSVLVVEAGDVALTAVATASGVDDPTPDDAVVGLVTQGREPLADLAVSASPLGTLTVGKTAVHRVTVTAAGPEPAAGAAVVVQVAGAGRIVGASGAGLSCAGVGDAVECVLGALAPGAKRDVNVTLEATDAGVVTVLAQVGALTSDPALGNNGVVVTVAAVNGCAAGGCDDGDPCTADGCTPDSGCTHVPAAGACDDGNACTVDDACVGGVCVGGGPLACAEGAPCTLVGCDPNAGCVVLGAATACDDGDVCTTGDVCLGVTCAGGAPLDCDDGDPCTTDSCDPSLGCVHAGAGVCCAVDADCAPPGPCLVVTCDVGAGLCVTAAAPDGGACDDGAACTAGDACVGGACVGAPLVCDDGDPCTADSCGAAGCEAVLLVDGANCDDGDPCTLDDACADGVCDGTAACDDGEPCTADACDPATGACSHGPASGVACDDGDPCSGPDVCAAGLCAGAPLSCDDGVACTADSCDAGGCVHDVVGACCATDADCDGDPCVPGACIAGVCAFEPLADGAPCDDGDPCTVGETCGEDGCTGGAAACDDGDPCTVDSCDAATGDCTHGSAVEGGVCDDGDPCTGPDQCVAGVCAGAPADCDDGVVCTVDGCDPDLGCTHEGVAGCCLSDPECAPADPCLVGSCDGATGACLSAPGPAGTPCDDGDPCTGTDVCADGVCAGTPLVCDDGDPCTTDACSVATGVCTNTPLPGGCGGGEDGGTTDGGATDGGGTDGGAIDGGAIDGGGTDVAGGGSDGVAGGSDGSGHPGADGQAGADSSAGDAGGAGGLDGAGGSGEDAQGSSDDAPTPGSPTDATGGGDGVAESPLPDGAVPSGCGCRIGRPLWTQGAESLLLLALLVALRFVVRRRARRPT